MTSDALRFLRARPVVRAVALACGLLTAIIGAAVLLSLAAGDASRERTDAQAALERYTYSWQTRIGTRLSEASSLAASGASFAAGGATVAPNHTLGVAERVQFINNDSWPIIAESLFEQVPGVLSLQLQPSGIIAQMWPPNSGPQNLDTWNLPHISEAYRALARGRVPVTAGPVPLAQGGMGLLVRYPVYVDPRRRLEDFWGAGVVVFRIVDMLAAMNITARHAADGYDVICFAEDLTNTSSAPSVILSTPGARRHADAGNVRPDGSYTVRIETADPNNALYLTTMRTDGLPSKALSASRAIGILIPIIIVALLVAAFVFAVALLSFKLKHRHAPVTGG
eukprot:CAMPEP_0174845992 /NCGR_PEP_ID=MMETSP1114-20130205/12058_1 /TAXON_ID=312471 /ORGANISM="Neobodo designis, Strain CCAP 1951/1" /LENGTH=338 /DNA_ID=CAMNT_0016080249 /DNA_START=222 /DNA_END=1234 /DNA_ORIENTATION=+